MGDWVETDIGFVNFDQVLLFRVDPRLPEPDSFTFSGKPKSVPSRSLDVQYTIRASFADGIERSVWSGLNWQEAWNIRTAWREMLRKQAQGGSSVGYVFSVGI